MHSNFGPLGCSKQFTFSLSGRIMILTCWCHAFTVHPWSSRRADFKCSCQQQSFGGMGYSASIPLRRVQEHYIWPGMRKHVREYISHCVWCNTLTPANPAQPRGIIPTPDRAFLIWAVDLVGPFSRDRKGESPWKPGFQVLSSYDGALRVLELATGNVVRINQRNLRKIPMTKPYEEIDPIHQEGTTTRSTPFPSQIENVLGSQPLPAQEPPVLHTLLPRLHSPPGDQADEDIQ